MPSICTSCSKGSGLSHRALQQAQSHHHLTLVCTLMVFSHRFHGGQILQVPAAYTGNLKILLPAPQATGVGNLGCSREVSVFSCSGRGEWGLHSLKNEDATE